MAGLREKTKGNGGWPQRQGRIDLGKATVFSDAGGPGLAGIVSFIAAKAEFTPRNVQTADERSRLVYRVKVGVDNANGVLKPGMPVEAEIQLQ